MKLHSVPPALALTALLAFATGCAPANPQEGPQSPPSPSLQR